jgi:quercetin dioxygenase-like cupin family protein
MAPVDLHKAALDFIAEVSAAQERKKKTLIDTADLQVFLLYIRENGEVPAHRTKGEITVQILTGNIRMGVDGSEYPMSAGCLLPIGSNVPHQLRAEEDSVCLVTMARPH